MADDVIFGLHAVAAALEQEPDNVLRLLCTHSRKDRRLNAVIAQAEQHGIAVSYVDVAELDRKSDNARHQSVVAEYRAPAALNEDALLTRLDAVDTPWLILILDSVQDPHNLGACLRTADAAGVDAIIAPKDRAVGITPVVRKVAAGAAARVPFYQVTNLKRVIEKLQQAGVWIVGTSDQASQDYTAFDYTGPVALAMGAESKGLRRLVQASCDALVSIPMAGTVSSLNVSVATGVCLYEAVRQRRGSAKPSNA